MGSYMFILNLESITNYGIYIESWIYHQLWDLYWILNWSPTEPEEFVAWTCHIGCARFQNPELECVFSDVLGNSMITLICLSVFLSLCICIYIYIYIYIVICFYISYYIISYYIILYYNILYHIILYDTILYYIILIL